jgi:D-ribose pyranose/furanose isomerase RbsD
MENTMIDDQSMNPGTQSLCNTMSVKTYDEVIGRVTAAIGTQQENPQMWAKIQKPLSMLQQSNNQIGQERDTTMDGQPTNNGAGITGDSMVDEANTWWAAIQSIICEQGPEFQ